MTVQTPVGIDNTQQSTSASLNAVAADNECVKYAYVRMQQSTMGIDTQSTNVFLQKELEPSIVLCGAPLQTALIHFYNCNLTEWRLCNFTSKRSKPMPFVVWTHPMKYHR
ncbi:MAG: hypothetical protein ACQ9ET_04835 [Nitrosomonadaceae bacterium]|jgi:hypothetical protein